MRTHPHLAAVWQRRGCPRRILAAGIDQRLSVFGALEYRLGIFTSAFAPTSNAAHFRVFLDQVAARWSDDHLVLDNAGYRKTADLRAWCAANADRVSVVWLPTYRPHLNLIERVWRFANGKLACHRLWNDLDALSIAAQTVLDRTRATFAAPTYPHITLGQECCMSA